MLVAGPQGRWGSRKSLLQACCCFNDFQNSCISWTVIKIVIKRYQRPLCESRRPGHTEELIKGWQDPPSTPSQSPTPAQGSPPWCERAVRSPSLGLEPFPPAAFRIQEFLLAASAGDFAHHFPPLSLGFFLYKKSRLVAAPMSQDPSSPLGAEHPHWGS